AAAAGRKIARLPWHRRSCRAQRRPPAARARGASTLRWRVGSSPAALLRRGDDEEAALFDADVLEAERFQRADDALASLEGMMLAAIRRRELAAREVDGDAVGERVDAVQR